MTEKTRELVDRIAPWATLLALGLGALLAYSEARFVAASAYAQEHAAVVAEVSDVRTQAAGTTQELRGEIKAIRAEQSAQGRQLDRIERALERIAAERSHPIPSARQ